jgi:hypothetical protein
VRREIRCGPLTGFIKDFKSRLSAPSLDKPTAASNIEETHWVRGSGRRRPWGWGYGYRPWGWGDGYRPWGWGYGYRPWGWATVIARGVTVTVGVARGAPAGVRSFRWNVALYLTARGSEASRDHSSPAGESRGASLLGGAPSLSWSGGP